ncbi:MAG TPA: hypothetical protein VK484_03475 [Ferruginibacter sp.]|nr:hypothetical protein [Ferruginibacter sp.]
MSKGLIAFIVVACIGLASTLFIFMKRSADESRNESERIMEEFKKVDKDLQETNRMLDSTNNMHLDSMKYK